MTPLEAWRLHCSDAKPSADTESAAGLLYGLLAGRLSPRGAEPDHAQMAAAAVLTRNRGRRQRLLVALRAAAPASASLLRSYAIVGGSVAELEGALGRPLLDWEQAELGRSGLHDEAQLFVLLRRSARNAFIDLLRREAKAERAEDAAEEAGAIAAPLQEPADLDAARARREVDAAQARVDAVWDRFSVWRAGKPGSATYRGHPERVRADLNLARWVVAKPERHQFDNDSHRRRCARLRLDLTDGWTAHRIAQGEEPWTAHADAVVADMLLRQREKSEGAVRSPSPARLRGED
jgi:hypothetical protein